MTTHKHTWYPVSIPCTEGDTHPAVRCAEVTCPLHAYPIDITRYGDPRQLEAKMAEMRADLNAKGEVVRAAYQSYQALYQDMGKLADSLRTLEGHYRQVTALPGQQR